MSNRALSISEASVHLKRYISRQGLYKWIERGEIRGERAPGGRWTIRESEVVRVLAWYEDIDPEEVRARINES